MTRREKTEDVVAYVFGGALFTAVSVVTAAFMAVGLVFMPVIERLYRR